MADDLCGFHMTGRLCASMETRHTQNGYAIGNFVLAVNRSEKKDGQWTEVPSFFDCALYGKSVENLAQYLVKGKQVAVEGYPKQDRWQKDGQSFSRVRFIVEKLQLIGGNRNGQQTQQQSYQAPQSYPQTLPPPPEPDPYDNDNGSYNEMPPYNEAELAGINGIF